MTAFEELAEAVHREHLLASGVASWHECQWLLCFKARRLTAIAPRNTQQAAEQARVSHRRAHQKAPAPRRTGQPRAHGDLVLIEGVPG